MFNLQNLTPEQRLLIGCLRLDERADELAREISQEKPDWPVLREEAIRQGVFPPVFQRLKSLPPGSIPPMEWNRYKELYLLNGQRNLRLAQRLIQVLELLSRRGIKALTFKGPALALQAYGDLSLRQITDLDFLIRRDDVEPVFSILGQAGYRTARPLTAGMVRHLARTGKEFWLRDADTRLDFHQQMPEGPPSFRLKEILWEKRGSVTILHYPVPVLSPENTLLLLLIHGTEHGWDTLKNIADLGYFIQANSELDWEEVLSRVSALRSLRILALGLILTETLLELRLPTDLKGIIHRDQKARTLAETILGGLFDGTDSQKGLMVFQRSFDSLADRLKYLGYYALAPRTSDWMARPLPDALFPLYYFYRPLHNLAKFGPTLFRYFR